MISPHLMQQLRNTPVRERIRALERDGFSFRRRQGSGRLSRHPDGRRALIHSHGSGDTLPIGTLREVLRGTRWEQEDSDGHHQKANEPWSKKTPMKPPELGDGMGHFIGRTYGDALKKSAGEYVP